MDRKVFLSALFYLATVTITFQVAKSSNIPLNINTITLSFAGVVKNTAPSVVNIYTKVKIPPSRRKTLFNDPFFKRFFGDAFPGYPKRHDSQRQNSLGSGVLVSANGLIVTNQHVISGADEIMVVLNDRRQFDAQLIATDKKSDLSFLKIDTKEPLPYLKLTNSDNLKVGDLVLAIGNPFGVGQTVTNGIISALSRTGVGLSKLNAFIQTDAAINPGNSGGALVTLNGELAGINTAIFSNSGGSHGIGFAIPSNMVGAVLPGIKRYGKIIRGWLGASGHALTQEIASSVGLTRPVGIIVASLHNKGGAARVGIKIGDIITKINDTEIFNENELAHRIASIPVGQTVQIKILRDGKSKIFTLNMAPAPEVPRRNLTKLIGDHPLSGCKIANMSPALAEELDSDPYIEGVIITEIKRGSFAERLGFRVNDIIRSLGSIEIKYVSNLERQLRKKRTQWQITVLRNGKFLNLVIK